MPVLVPISIVLAGFFQGIIITLLTTIAMEIPGLQRNVASSAIVLSAFRWSFSTICAGVIGEHIGESYAFYFAGAIVLISVCCIIYHRNYFATNEEE